MFSVAAWCGEGNTVLCPTNTCLLPKNEKVAVCLCSLGDSFSGNLNRIRTGKRREGLDRFTETAVRRMSTMDMDER